MQGYQIGLLPACVPAVDPFPSDTCRTLRATLEARLAELGIDVTRDVAFLDPSSVSRAKPKVPIAAAYVGGQAIDATAISAVDSLLRLGAFVLPIVPDLARFAAYVPAALQGNNGMPPNRRDEKFEGAAARILEALHLLRRRRLAFISYKRSESSGVAEQLREALERERFEVFLDTYSVERGVDFQSVLWDRMGDADLIVLLDTPGAFTSKWVEQEVTHAHLLGLGMLQMVWPTPPGRTPGTDLCDPVYLEPADFVGSPRVPGPGDVLVPDRIGEMVARAEAVRARAMAPRRGRVTAVFRRRAEAAGLSVAIQPEGFIDVRSQRGGESRVLAGVGHPDSVELYDLSRAVGSTSTAAALLYDGLGMLRRKADHLEWLNGYLPAKSFPVADGVNLDAWLKTLP